MTSALLQLLVEGPSFITEQVFYPAIEDDSGL
jgi:hypothetical protein